MENIVYRRSELNTFFFSFIIVSVPDNNSTVVISPYIRCSGFNDGVVTFCHLYY